MPRVSCLTNKIRQFFKRLSTSNSSSNTGATGEPSDPKSQKSVLGPATPPPPHDLLDEGPPYRRFFLGEGASCTVWGFYSRHAQRWLAVKFFVESENFKEQIASEVGVLSKLKKYPHPNLLAFLPRDDFQSVRQMDDHTAIITEYHPVNLESFMWKITAPDSLALMLYATVAGEIAAGLKHLHQLRIIHRDIKPANILISKDGHCVIADYGLSYFRQNFEDVECVGPPVGIPLFAAPEMHTRDFAHFDERCDFYSLGVTLLDLIGVLPPSTSGKSHEPTIFEPIPPILDGGEQMRNALACAAVPAEMTEFIISLCQVDRNKRMHADSILPTLDNFGAGGASGSEPPFTVTWLPNSPQPWVEWNISMEPKKIDLQPFLSRTIRRPPRTCPNPNFQPAQDPAPASSDAPDIYYHMPPYLVRHVQDAPPLPLTGRLFVQKCPGGFDRIVEVVALWPADTPRSF